MHVIPTRRRSFRGVLPAALGGLLLSLLTASPPSGAAAAAASDHQAETATISQGTVASNHSGYTGSGFVDYTNVTGSYVEFTVSADAAGGASLAFRYANGTGADRPMDISIGGRVVVPNVSFPPTANWTTWATKTINAGLAAGSNKIRATATTSAGGPNLDKLTVDAAADTQAPTRPGTPNCSAVTEDGLTLNWGASTDDVAVTAYDIYEHGNKIGEAAGSATTKNLTGLTPATTYNLTVIARDAAGNASSPARPWTARPGPAPTPARRPGPAPCRTPKSPRTAPS